MLPVFVPVNVNDIHQEMENYLLTNARFYEAASALIKSGLLAKLKDTIVSELSDNKTIEQLGIQKCKESAQLSLIKHIENFVNDYNDVKGQFEND